MLSDKEKNELINEAMQKASLPAVVQGELAAFRHGVVVAINAIGGAVSVDKETPDTYKKSKNKKQ